MFTERFHAAETPLENELRQQEHVARQTAALSVVGLFVRIQLAQRQRQRRFFTFDRQGDLQGARLFI